jgi:predicted AlkP superfamily pyrophosphatase or phosphodiesterase
MKHLDCHHLFFYLSFLLLTLLSFSAWTEAADRPELTLFISLDGFRPDYIELYRPPHLQRLIHEGVRVASSEVVFPYTTTANMTSLLTGAFPATTGIANNAQYVAQEDRIVSGPRDNRAKTIAEILSASGFRCASVNHFMLENRGVQTYVKGDIRDVIELVKSRQYDFIAYYFAETDKVGHRNGPFGPEMREAVLKADEEIGQLIRALEEMGIYENTLITVNSDHGMSPFEKKNVEPDPVRTLKAAGFKIAENQKQIEPDTEVIVLSMGSRLIYLRKPLSDERRALLENRLKTIQGAQLLGRAELDALHAHNNRSGDYALVPLPGYAISNAGDPGGLHGRPAEKYGFLIFHGPGVRKGALVDAARSIDIVPTLLRLLNVPKAQSVDGIVIDQALESKK